MLKIWIKIVRFIRTIGLLLIDILLTSLNIQVKIAPRTFYVDEVIGNDSYDGTSTLTAWKTLEKVNSIILKPSDQVLLKAGCVWSGERLKPQGSGQDGKCIMLDQYGTGAKPHIATNGAYLYACELINQQYIEVNNLQISNQGTTELAHRTGIYITAEDIGICRHIYLKNLYVHNVNGDGILKDWDNGGIYFVVNGTSVATKYDDILIEGCTVENVNRTGISIAFSSWHAQYNNQSGAYPQITVDTYSHTNVVIRHNKCKEIGGDGIVSMYCKNPLIEWNVIIGSCKTSTSTGQYSAALWPWRCEDAIFQYNEVYNTYQNVDGQSFDCDWSNRTIYQYNYSHDNVSGFIMFCMNESLGSIVRYNISENDGTLDGVIANINGSPGPIGTVYNNTFYMTSNTRLFRHTGGNLLFYNNIFYNANGINNSSWDSAITYSHNVYYGFSNTPDDSHKITINPQLMSPGSGSNGLNTVDGYKLQATSPCINRGVTIANNGGIDYWGNTVTYNGGDTDIGAHEYVGTPITTVTVDDRDLSINKSGNWKTRDSSAYGYYNGTISLSNILGNYCEFTFAGTSIKFYGIKDVDLGKADIYVDAVLEQTIDQYSLAATSSIQLFSKTGMPNTQHTIKVVVKNEKHPNAVNSYVVIDAFEYTIN